MPYRAFFLYLPPVIIVNTLQTYNRFHHYARERTKYFADKAKNFAFCWYVRYQQEGFLYKNWGFKGDFRK